MSIKRFLFQIPCQNILGENVLWHSQLQALFWTDIQAKELHVWQHNEVPKKAHKVISLPSRLGCFMFTENPNILIAGFEDGLAKFNYETGERVWTMPIEKDNEHTRLNDGKCDPKGRFWFGTMVEKGEFNKLDVAQQGALYRADFDSNGQAEQSSNLKITQVLSGIHISNGLCFNHNASIMYHTDSSSHKVYRYQLNENGDILERDLFAKFDKHCFPDGACVDAKGNVWIALWGGACIVCIDPLGKELFRHPLPVTQGTCVAIGGPNMNRLFVTTARDGLNEKQLGEQPRAGNVLVYELN